MKNVILILTDQQRYDSLGATGCAEAMTPTLDRLARESGVFQNHMVTNPVSSPSRASIWTGKMPSAAGLCANGFSLGDSEPTLAMDFQKHGYETAHFGKLHLEAIVGRGLAPRNFGFDRVELGEGDQYLGHDDYGLWLRREDPGAFFKYHHQMGEMGHRRAYASNLPENRTLSRWVVDRGLDFLRRPGRRDRPFFLSLGFFDPHHAWNPCEPWAGRFATRGVTAAPNHPEDLARKREIWGPEAGLDPFDLANLIRAYHAMIAHLDDCLASLMAHLEQSGRLRDTVIAFSSDHGEFLGRHGRLFKGPFLCVDLLKVPMILRHPDRPVERRVLEPTSALDLRETLLRSAGLDGGTDPGAKPLMGGDGGLFPEGCRDGVPSEWRYPGDHGVDSILSLRTARERYVVDEKTGREEYYRHPDDPNEWFDRSADPATRERMGELRAMLSRIAPPIPDVARPLSPW